MKPIAILTSLTAMAFLFGCSVLPKPVSQDVYHLPEAPLPRSSSHNVDWSLRVDTPKAGRMIDSSRIVVQPEGELLTVYKSARWSDSATDLLRDRLIDAFRDDGRITGLSSDKDSLQADYFLSSDLRAFQTEYLDGRPVVVIRLDAQLVRAQSMRIIASHRFEVSYPSEGSATTSVVPAFGRAGDTLCGQVVAWAVSSAGTSKD